MQREEIRKALYELENINLQMARQKETQDQTLSELVLDPVEIDQFMGQRTDFVFSLGQRRARIMNKLESLGVNDD